MSDGPVRFRDVEVRWLTAFIDRPAGTFTETTDFWQAVTRSSLSPTRGEYDEFATLLPPSGDAYLRVQRVASGPGGSHLDLHVEVVGPAAEETVSAGAVAVVGTPHVATLRSPAGLTFCIVRHDGQLHRAPPHPLRDGEHELLLVDQLCLDIPANRYEAECGFWERVTGWTHVRSSRPEFGWLESPADMPLRLVLQRRDDSDGPARCHLDIASDDRTGLAGRLEALGARNVGVFDRWIVMTDPAHVEFCVTARDPRTSSAP